VLTFVLNVIWRHRLRSRRDLLASGWQPGTNRSRKLLLDDGVNGVDHSPVFEVTESDGLHHVEPLVTFVTGFE
jgi:hypothetical protein